MNTEERLQKFLGAGPTIDPSCYVADSAEIVGDVRLAENVSVWPKAVLRGDINYIKIGAGSNIQDGCIFHLSDGYPLIVGEDVTVGHGAILHACEVEDACLIGMRATVLDGSVIGENSVVGAGALVTPGTFIEPGSLVMGLPAKTIRKLSDEEIDKNRYWAAKYRKVAAAHKAANH